MKNIVWFARLIVVIVLVIMLVSGDPAVKVIALLLLVVVGVLSLLGAKAESILRTEKARIAQLHARAAERDRLRDPANAKVALPSVSSGAIALQEELLPKSEDDEEEKGIHDDAFDEALVACAEIALKYAASPVTIRPDKLDELLRHQGALDRLRAAKSILQHHPRISRQPLEGPSPQPGLGWLDRLRDLVQQGRPQPADARPSLEYRWALGIETDPGRFWFQATVRTTDTPGVVSYEIDVLAS